MAFIKSFSISTQKTAPFPYNIPAVQFAKDISLGEGITIFVGDNGTGKSTLLESIGHKLNLPLMSGGITATTGFEAARSLKPYVDIEWLNQTAKGFFFRAEDFSDFINAVENEKRKIADDFRDLRGKVDDRIIEQMSESRNYALHKIRQDYGGDMQAFSHGEAYLKIIQTRITDKGIYLLDEPEAALSPLKQLSLIAYILDVLKTVKAQFIIATHSPLLMGIPGATLYEINEEEMRQVSYYDTEHYQITKRFLDDPEYYLRHLQ
jgi:predicted ATPase